MAIIWYQLQEKGLLQWRRAFRFEFEEALVFPDGVVASYGYEDDGPRPGATIIVLDKLGETILRREIASTAREALGGTAAPPRFIRGFWPIITDEVAIVWTTRREWRRFSLVTGEEVNSIDLYRKLQDKRIDVACIVSCEPIVGTAYVLVHAISNGDYKSYVESMWTAVDSECDVIWSFSEMVANEGLPSDACRTAEWLAARGEGACRIDGNARFAIRRKDRWVGYHIVEREGVSVVTVADECGR